MRAIFILSISLIFVAGPIVHAQDYVEPQWKFHLAFEDATGAMDTIWIVLDTAATSGGFFDVQFGEVPVELSPNEFNVWLNYWGPPYYKTLALTLNHHPLLVISANNYVLPITLSWDTALFRAPVLMQNINGPINAPLLDSQFFFNYHSNFNFYPQYAWASYCMLYDTQVELPWFSWGSGEHFPLICTMGRGFGNPLTGSDPLLKKPALQLYPNPVGDWLRVDTKESWVEYQVLNAQGQVVLQGFYNAVQPGVDVGSLPTGAYILRLKDGKGEKVGAGRFVKHP